MREKHEDISKRLLTAESELKETRQTASSALAEVKAKEVEKELSDNICAEAKSQLATLVQDNDRLKSELASVKAEAERLKSGLEKYRPRLEQFSQSYVNTSSSACHLTLLYRLAALGSGLRELGQAHKSAREQLQLLRWSMKTLRGDKQLRRYTYFFSCQFD